MVLQQSGNTVTGTYTHDQGQIQGTVLGNKLIGTWTEAPSRSSPDDAGDFEFRISDDCNSFNGNWGYGSSSEWSGGWSGTRQSSGPSIPGPSSGYTNPSVSADQNPAAIDQESSNSILAYKDFYNYNQMGQTGIGSNQYEPEPSYLIINGQSRPYDPRYVPSNSLWIQGKTSWTQYIKCPLNAWYKVLAVSYGGRATMVETYSDGSQQVKTYNFYNGYTPGVFEADAVGRHTLNFYINGQKSNSVIVDVVSNGAPYTFGSSSPLSQTSSTVIISSGNIRKGSGQMPGKSCDITGTWKFGDNGPYNIVYPDGTIVAKNAQGEIFDRGTWKVIDGLNRKYGFTWESGWRHTFTLSADCSSLDGFGTSGSNQEPCQGIRVTSSGSSGYSTTITGNILVDSTDQGFDPNAYPGGLLVDSANQGFDPTSHPGGLLVDTANDLGYSQGGEPI